MPPADLRDQVRAQLTLGEAAHTVGCEGPTEGPVVCPNAGCDGHQAQERTVTFDGDAWRCAICQAGGDVVDLVRAARGLSESGALGVAARIAGIRVDAPQITAPAERIVIEPADLAERHHALAVATDHYDRLRREGDEYIESLGAMALSDHQREEINRGLRTARRYLQRRGLAPLAAMPLPIGLVPAKDTGLLARLKSDGDGDLVAAARRCGLITRHRNPRERYAGRVFLPWRDPSGRVWNVKGRGILDLANHCGLAVDEEGRLRWPMLFLSTADHNPKNPPHMPRPTHPFGYLAAQQLLKGATGDHPIIILEGEIDAVSGLLAGVPCVSTGGTSGSGRAPLKDLVFGDDVVVSDGDESGRRAAPRLAWTLQCRHTTLPEGDLNDVLRTAGPGGVRVAVAEAVERAEPAPTHDPKRRESDDERFRREIKESAANEGGPSEDARTTEGMPPSWGMARGRLYRIKYGKDGNEEWVPTGIREPPAIAWRGRDVRTHEIVIGLTGNVVASTDKAEIVVPRGLLKNTRGIIEALADQGFDCDANTARTMIRFLGDYEFAFGGELEFRHGADQCGWHGRTFLYGDEAIGEREMAYIGTENAYVDALGTAGTQEGWIEGVLRPMERYPMAIFGLYAALAAPLVTYVPGVTGFALEYTAQSSTGKSTISSAIASAFGNTDLNSPLLRGPTDTWIALELHASFMRNLPLFLEDTHILQRDRLRDVVMTWVNGQSRGRGQRSGKARQKPRQWSTVSILTGESSVVDSTTYGGVAARVLSFPSPLPRPAEGGSDAAVVDDIHTIDAARCAHYGHAARLWIAWLADNHNIVQVLETYDSWVSTIRRSAPKHGPAQRWAKDIAIVVAVARHAGPLIGAADADKAESDCLQVGIEQLRSRRIPDQAAEAMDMLLAWVAMDASGGVDEDQSAAPNARKVWYRRTRDGTLLVSAQEARERLDDQDIVLTAVRREWVHRGWLVWHKKPTGSTVQRMASGPTRCLPIAASVAEGFEAEAKQQETGGAWRRDVGYA